MSIQLEEYCGTRKGYEQHLKKQEPTCNPCRVSNSARRKTWTDANPGHFLKYTANPQVSRRARLLITYGLTIEDYDNLLTDQGGMCKICAQPETTLIKGVVIRLAVDHCHKTGKIRGLLCSGCNTALGGFNDNIDIMNKAIDYLKENK